MKTGIYQILNLTNNKRYIGSSKKIENRWREHKTLLRTNKHHSQHLQASFNKYGLSNFEFSILEITTEELLQEKENYWCNLFNTHNSKYGYNVAAVTRNGNVCEVYQKKQSINCYNKKRVWLTSKQGTILNVFNSVTEASKILNVSIINIQSLKKGKTILYKNEFMLWEGFHFTNKNIKQRLLNSKEKNFKKVYQFDKHKKLIKIYTSKKAVLLANPNIKGIDEALRNTRINNSCQAGDYFWSYNENGPTSFVSKNIMTKKIYQYSKDKTTLIKEFNSLQEAVLETDAKIKGIQKVLSGNRNFHRDFFWSRTLL